MTDGQGQRTRKTGSLHDGVVFAIVAALSCAAWLASPVLTGNVEPWDARTSGQLTYAAAIALAAGIGGFLRPKRFWLWPAAVYLGQAVALPLQSVFHPPGGASFILAGMVILIFYSLPGVLGSATGAGLGLLPQPWSLAAAALIVVMVGAWRARDRNEVVRLRAETDSVKLATALDAAIRARNHERISEVAGNPNASSETIGRVAFLYETQSASTAASWELVGLASQPKMPQDLLAKYARHPDTNLRLAVAGNPSTPVSLLSELVRDHDPSKVVSQRAVEALGDRVAGGDAEAADALRAVCPELMMNPAEREAVRSVTACRKVGIEAQDLEGRRKIVWAARAEDVGRLLLVETWPAFEAIYELAGNTLTPTYPAAVGAQAVAAAKDGSIYFSNIRATARENADDFTLYRLRDGRREPVFHHKTAISDVEVDEQGTVFFSEVTGAGGDGIIYRLDGNEAEPFFTVRLSEVDGFWAGYFAFDRQHRLWLSSGNQVPSSLYQVVEGRPARRYQAAEHCIMSLAFDKAGNIVYPDDDHTVWRLDTESWQAVPIVQISGAAGLSKVILLESK